MRNNEKSGKFDENNDVRLFISFEYILGSEQSEN